MQGDIFDREFVEAALRDYLPFDVVLSDMAPATSGIKVADSARSALLFERAFEIARWALQTRRDFSGQDISWVGVPPVARGGQETILPDQGHKTRGYQKTEQGNLYTCHESEKEIAGGFHVRSFEMGYHPPQKRGG